VLWSLLRKMRGEMTTWCANSVLMPACAYFDTVRRKNLLALASDGFLQNLALEPLRAIREIGRRAGDVAANCVRGICSTIIAAKE
jgi:hypothetical protein